MVSDPLISPIPNIFNRCGRYCTHRRIDTKRGSRRSWSKNIGGRAPEGLLLRFREIERKPADGFRRLRKGAQSPLHDPLLQYPENIPLNYRSLRRKNQLSPLISLLHPSFNSMNVLIGSSNMVKYVLVTYLLRTLTVKASLVKDSNMIQT